MINEQPLSGHKKAPKEFSFLLKAVKEILKNYFKKQESEFTKKKQVSSGSEEN